MAEKALHGGCPVYGADSVKYGINAWVWNKPRQSTRLSAGGSLYAGEDRFGKTAAEDGAAEATGLVATAPAKWDPYHPALPRIRVGWDPETESRKRVLRVGTPRELRMVNVFGKTSEGEGASEGEGVVKIFWLSENVGVDKEDFRESESCRAVW